MDRREMALGATVSSARNRVATLFALLAFCAALLGIGASSAAALPTKFFGFQFSSNYAQSAPDVAAMGRAGAKYLRINLNWGDKEKNGWGPYDEAFERAWENGITIIPDLYGNQSGNPQRPWEAEWSPKNSGWEKWLYEVVQHYGYGGSFWSGKANPLPAGIWEVWNEPNRGANGPDGVNPFPQEYARFLKRSASALREAQGATPVTVLMGGLLTQETKAQEEGGKWRSNESVQSFLAEVGKVSGSSEAFDGLSLHPYAFGSNAETVKTAVMSNITAARNKLNEVFGSGKGIWITELGWPVNPWGDEKHEGVSEAAQGEILKKVFEEIVSKQVEKNIQSLLYYFYRDDSSSPGWDRHTGLRDVNGGFRLPAWSAFQEVTGATKWPVSPTLTTQTASEISATQATLSGSVNPQGLPTKYKFEYGLTESYGSSVPAPEGDAGYGTSAVQESAVAQGLRPGSTYYFRIAATNALGTFHGSASSFKTSPIVAYQGGQGELWSAGVPAGASNLTLGMGSAGSRPAITALSSGGYEVAIRSSADELWTYSSSGGATNLKLGMKSGSTPSIAALPSGGYVIAFQSNEGELWLYSSFGGAVNTHLGMGTTASSPSISTYSSGQYVVALRVFGNGLWVYSSTSGAKNLEQTLYAGSNPAVTTFSSGAYQVAYQSSAGELNTYSSSTGTNTNLGLGMGFEASTPSIATLSSGAWVIAFRAGSGELWTYSSTSGSTNTHLGMGSGATTPSIAASGSSYQVAFKAFGEELWSYAPGVGGSSTGLAMRAGSSPALAAG
jgi:hypothetical protein